MKPNPEPSSMLEQLHEVETEAEKQKVPLSPEIKQYISDNLEAIKNKLANKQPIYPRDMEFMKVVREWVDDERFKVRFEPFKKKLEAEGGSIIPVDIEVDYSLSLEQMIEAGHFKRVDVKITRGHFPVSADTSENRKYYLINFGKFIHTQVINAELSNAGCFLAATLPELLALSTQVELDRDPFAILGSPWRDPKGNIETATMSDCGAGRELELTFGGNPDMLWRSEVKFLFRRK